MAHKHAAKEAQKPDHIIALEKERELLGLKIGCVREVWVGMAREEGGTPRFQMALGSGAAAFNAGDDRSRRQQDILKDIARLSECWSALVQYVQKNDKNADEIIGNAILKAQKKLGRAGTQR